MASFGGSPMRIMLEDIPEEETISITMWCLMCRQTEIIVKETGKIVPKVVCGLQQNNLQGNGEVNCTSTGKGQIM